MVGSYLGLHRKFLLVLICALLLPTVLAVDPFDAKVTPSELYIRMNESANFVLNISHPFLYEEVFEVYSPDVEWDLVSNPITDRIVNIAPQEEKAISLSLRPLYVHPGIYSIRLHIRAANANKLIKRNVVVNVRSAEPVYQSYLPALMANVSMDDEIDPRKEGKVSLYVKNRNRVNLSNLDIKVRSQTINKDYRTSLDPFEAKYIDLAVDLPDKTSPVSDVLRISIFAYDKDNKAYQFDVTPAPFQVTAYGEIEQEEMESSAFLFTNKTVRLWNTGNGDLEKTVRVKTHPIKNLFTTPVPHADKVKDGKEYFLQWRVKLSAGETKEVFVYIDYKPFFYWLFALLFLLLAINFFRKPLLIRKSLVVLNEHEGGVSEIKVVINIKNLSPKAIHGVLVMDKVPHIAQVVNKFELGTLAPDKILHHEAKGTLLKWHIGDLDRFEERIITYKIKTKLSVFGGLKLPPALVKYHSATGRERKMTAPCSDC